MTSDAEINDLQEEDFAFLAELHGEVSNAVFCALGRKFVAKFFRWLAEREDVCALGCRREVGRLDGVIVGMLDRRSAYRDVLAEHRWSLLAAAGWRLLSPRVLLWILRGVAARFGRRSKEPDLPGAELLFIAVRLDARGRGLGHKLVEGMESRFRRMEFAGEYTIRTEADNVRANRFYQRIGATLVEKRRHRGLLIHCYRKAMGPPGEKDQE